MLITQASLLVGELFDFRHNLLEIGIAEGDVSASRNHLVGIVLAEAAADIIRGETPGGAGDDL